MTKGTGEETEGAKGKGTELEWGGYGSEGRRHKAPNIDVGRGAVTSE